MKNKIIKIALINLVLLSLIFPQILFWQRENQIIAGEEIIGEPFFEEPALLKEPSIPGRIERTGTYFEIKDSEYLNITLESTEEITVVLESIPRMISLNISSSTDSTSTNLTIKGLEPNKIYYKYQDSYKQEAVFVSSETGSYSWTQDLSEPHHTWIQEVEGTIFLPEDCELYGVWEEATSTCTLNQDLTESVEITTNNITLDCNGYSITGKRTSYGIYLNNKIGVTIKNCTVSNFSYGIYLWSSSNNTLSNNKISFNKFAGIGLGYEPNYDNKIIDNNISNNWLGIFLYRGSLNKISDNDILNNTWDGIHIGGFSNTIENNTISNNGRIGVSLWGSAVKNNEVINNNIYLNNEYGILLTYASKNTITQNNVSLNNKYGIFLWRSLNNKIYHNNFIDNFRQAYVTGGFNNLFDNSYPSGGNYWSDYDTPEESCIDANNDGFCDSPYTFTGGQDNYPFMKESGWEALPPTLPDFSILEVKPVQVVWDSKIDDNDTIDLVAGKSTMIRVYVEMRDYEVLDKQQLIGVQFTFGVVDYIKSRAIEQLEQNNWIDFYPASPTTLGDQTIMAKVDPENKIEESDETNNENSIEVTVKDTNSLHLIYFPINRPITYFGYGPINMEEYSETVSQSGKFIGATYPVAEGEFTNQKSDWKYYGSPVPFLGMIDDVISIWTRGELVTRTRADVSIGIVPEDYFRYHLIGEAKGISLNLPGINGVLAEGGYWTAAAHEAGHRFGLRLDEEEYVTNPPGNRADGFWVGERREISNGVCFMGKAGANHSFSHSIKYDNRPIWIDNEDYEHLFKKFRVDKTDPDVLLMSGIISKDGTIQFSKLYMVEDGTIDYIIPGDYSIQILDTDGRALTNIPFYTSFEMYINPFGIIDTDFAGFTLTIPYPEETFKVRIQYKDENLIEFNPNTKLLHDAIDSIPDYGFIKNPEKRRNALHHKIDAVERMLDKNNLQGAIHKLEHDIKDKLEKWLVDNYEVEDPLQLSKVEVIELIQAIIERLSN